MLANVFQFTRPALQHLFCLWWGPVSHILGASKLTITPVLCKGPKTIMTSSLIQIFCPLSSTAFWFLYYSPRQGPVWLGSKPPTVGELTDTSPHLTHFLQGVPPRRSVPGTFFFGSACFDKITFYVKPGSGRVVIMSGVAGPCAISYCD